MKKHSFHMLLAISGIDCIRNSFPVDLACVRSPAFIEGVIGEGNHDNRGNTDFSEVKIGLIGIDILAKNISIGPCSVFSRKSCSVNAILAKTSNLFPNRKK